MPRAPRLDVIAREPFRLFFPLGILLGLIGAGHWLVYALGWTSAYSGLFHAAIQMQAYMTCFIMGFLLTALPRMAAAPVTSPREVLVMLAWLIIQWSALIGHRWIIADICFMGMLFTLAFVAGRRLMRRAGAQAAPPAELIWIPIALLHGLVGSGLMIAGQSGRAPLWAGGVGRPMVQQGWLLSIVLGVGGFMAPRLMGRELLPARLVGASPEALQRRRHRRVAVHALAGAALGASCWWEGCGGGAWAYVLRAAVITGELGWSVRLWRPPRAADLYVRLLWVSLWMIVIGYWLSAAWPRHRVDWLHVAFLGGFVLMTFAVGAMVALSHAGEAAQLRGAPRMLRLVGISTLTAGALRVSAGFFASKYFLLVAGAALCWIAAGVAWLALILPRLWLVPATDEIERLHAELKRGQRS